MIPIATLIAIVAILGLFLKYRTDIAKVEALRDGAEYARGHGDGMERAARLLESGSNALKSGVHSPSPAQMAAAIRAANTKSARE